MAPARLQFDMTLRPAGARATPRDAETPLRLLLLADLGGDRSVPLAARRPLKTDIDDFDRVLARIAPRLALELEGQALALDFASLDDFHPDHLFDRLPVFDALRRLRDEAGDPAQFHRVAAALGLAPVAAPVTAAPMTAAPSAAAPAAEVAADLERLLGRAPPAAPTAAATATGGTGAVLDRWLRDLVAPHAKPDTAPEQRAVVDAVDQALTTLMRRVLHAPAFQALEAAWRGADRLVRGLDLGPDLQLWLLDVSRDELRHDLQAHRDDLAASALHAHLHPAAGADAQRYGLLALDQAFGPEAEDLQTLAALGALAARAGAPLLAGAAPALVGAATGAELAEPRRWRAEDDESLAWWQALRTAPMAPWIGLVLPRVLMRLPYGAATDPLTRFAFEEMPPARPHEAYLWGGGAPALALLAGQAFQQHGWAMDLSDALELDDLPSHVHTADGERHQQPVAEWLMAEEAGQALLDRGLMPLMSYRNRPAARLLRWQSVASPPQALQGLGG
jgi:type VI secretion system protein ImpC